MIAIRSVCLGRDLHVMEHPLQLLGELETTFHLEFGEHTPLGIVRNRSALK
jgi:hypothetical protein